VKIQLRYSNKRCHCITQFDMSHKCKIHIQFRFVTVYRCHVFNFKFVLLRMISFSEFRNEDRYHRLCFIYIILIQLYNVNSMSPNDTRIFLFNAHQGYQRAAVCNLISILMLMVNHSYIHKLFRKQFYLLRRQRIIYQ
jgi:hypothetical protein